MICAKGDKAFKRDQFLEAISLYSDALILAPDDEDVLGCRSAVYAKLGMFNESKKDAESLIAVIPQKPKVSFMNAANFTVLHATQLALDKGEHGWYREERTHFPQIWPRFKPPSCHYLYMCVEFVIVSRRCSERFSPSHQGVLPHICYAEMWHFEGYGFQAVKSRIESPQILHDPA